MVKLEEEWVGLREVVSESVTVKRRMITLHTYIYTRKGGKERQREVEECILVLVNSIPDDNKCVIDEDSTGSQFCTIPVNIINNYLLLNIITCIGNVSISCTIITKSVRHLY